LGQVRHQWRFGSTMHLSSMRVTLAFVLRHAKKLDALPLQVDGRRV